MLVGDYTFVITATDLAGNQLVAEFTWTLLDPCDPVTLVEVADMPDIVYTVAAINLP